MVRSRVLARRLTVTSIAACLAVGVSACGPEPPAYSPPHTRPPEGDPRPLGVGWYCAHGKDERPFSMCARAPQDCATRRAAIAGVNPRLGECAPHPTAICFGFRAATSDAPSFECYTTSGDCLMRRNALLADTKSYANVSSCDAWD